MWIDIMHIDGRSVFDRDGGVGVQRHTWGRYLRNTITPGRAAGNIAKWTSAGFKIQPLVVLFFGANVQSSLLGFCFWWHRMFFWVDLPTKYPYFGLVFHAGIRSIQYPPWVSQLINQQYWVILAIIDEICMCAYQPLERILLQRRCTLSGRISRKRYFEKYNILIT